MQNAGTARVKALSQEQQELFIGMSEKKSIAQGRQRDKTEFNQVGP